MRISIDRAHLAINLLVEGMSVRAVERITNLHRDTICDLILTVGENCGRLLSRIVKAVPVDDVQCDEIWSFVGCKEKTKKKRGYTLNEIGDCWTFIAIERNTKLVLAHHVAKRDNTREFLDKLRLAVTGRFQISTDGWGGYTNNIPFVFRNDADFGQLIKTYASQQEQTRYSPAMIIRAEKRAVFGSPDPDNICTSHIERLNLTLRMNLRRFTRLTNAHSKSWKHHEAMQNILFAWYNFSRVHASLDKKTPAMESGLTDAVWSIERLLTEAVE
jgi:IS1 family transposase